MDLPLLFYPCYHSFGYSLSHQYSYFRWSTQGIASSPTMLKTMERITTKTPAHCHPLCLLLSKYWLCKYRCFRPCSRSWSTYMNSPKYNRHRGIGWEIFSALRHQLFLMPWSQWILMIGLSLLRRSCKWCSVIIVKRCC
jgi:hypothetical protein